MKKYQLNKILFLVSFWLGCTIFFAFYNASLLGFKSSVGGEHYNFITVLITGLITCLIGASVLGSLEVLYLSKILRKKALGTALIIKTTIYIVFMLFFISAGEIFIYSSDINKSIFSKEVFTLYVNSLLNTKLLMAVIFWGIACMLALFILQVSDKFGRGVLLNFILGKYHTPKEEERIFMFLDLTSATSIAEKLNPHKYSSFLRDFFFDIDDAIYETNGAVFQFVGDEVVIIWNVEKGVKDNNCIKFFFLAEKIITANKNKYLENYGVCPTFKAGLHYGKVIITEVGGSKSEIAYHGDTINTASRISKVCNKYQKRFLVSAELLSLMHHIDNDFDIESIGICQLKGKENVVALFSIKNKLNELENVK